MRQATSADCWALTPCQRSNSSVNHKGLSETTPRRGWVRGGESNAQRRKLTEVAEKTPRDGPGQPGPRERDVYHSPGAAGAAAGAAAARLLLALDGGAVPLADWGRPR